MGSRSTVEIVVFCKGLEEVPGRGGIPDRGARADAEHCGEVEWVWAVRE